jgi:hypothetical protein
MGVCGKCDELPFFYAITKDLREVKESVFSTTEILRPQLQVRLQRTQPYYSTPEDLTIAAFGTAFHMLIAHGQEDLHNAGFEEYEFERALRFEEILITNYGPVTLTGQPDQYNFNTNILLDYKTLKYFYDGRALREGKINETSSLIKHKHQTNIYRRHKFPDCKKIKLFALYKDYNNRLKKEGIPPYELHDVPMMPNPEVDILVSSRLNLHMAAQSGDPCPPCTPDERYYQEASSLSLACLFYCSVRDICPIKSQFVTLDADGNPVIPEDTYKPKAPAVRTKGGKNGKPMRRTGSGVSKKI